MDVDRQPCFLAAVTMGNKYVDINTNGSSGGDVHALLPIHFRTKRA